MGCTNLIELKSTNFRSEKFKQLNPEVCPGTDAIRLTRANFRSVKFELLNPEVCPGTEGERK